MTMPRLVILDQHGSVAGHLDNNTPDGIHYYDDSLRIFLKGSANVLTFTCKNTTKTTSILKEGYKVAFIYNGESFYMNILEVEVGEFEITVTAYGAMLDLINAEVDEYKADKSMSFEDYIDDFDANNLLTIGVNELSGSTRKITFDSVDTLLERIYSLASEFDAEVAFRPVLHKNGELDKMMLDIYHEFDDENHGIGEETEKVLRYGKDYQWLKKNVDLTDFCTALRPIGKDNITLKDYEKTITDSDGDTLYYTRVGSSRIYAPQARDKYPANGIAGNDYVIRPYKVETLSKDKLWSTALKELKRRCKPKVTYSMKGYIDAHVGDSFRINDNMFSKSVLLRCRISEQKISMTNPGSNMTTFSNFTTLKSGISSQIKDTVKELKSSPPVVYTICETPADEPDKSAPINQGAVEDGNIVVVSFENGHESSEQATLEVGGSVYSVVLPSGEPAQWYDNTTLILSVSGDNMIVTNEEATNYNADGDLQTRQFVDGENVATTQIYMRSYRSGAVMTSYMPDGSYMSLRNDGLVVEDLSDASKSHMSLITATDIMVDGLSVKPIEFDLVADGITGRLRVNEAIGTCSLEVKIVRADWGGRMLAMGLEPVIDSRYMPNSNTALTCYYNGDATAGAYITSGGNVYVDIRGNTANQNAYVSGSWMFDIYY